jgi:hypothetical protein
VGAFLWFALACLAVVSNATVDLYLACILGGLLLNSTVPLFYEAAVEVRAAPPPPPRAHLIWPGRARTPSPRA